jgi:putative ABC transport system permease protein
MKFNDLFSMAFYNLWRRKMRTFLTVLAVVIGALLVALMVSIGSGLQNFIVNQFGLFMANDAMIVTSSPNQGAAMANSSGPHDVSVKVATKPFSTQDLQNIKAISGVTEVDYRFNVPGQYIQPVGTSLEISVSPSATPLYVESLRKLAAGDYVKDGSTGNCVISYDYLSVFGWPDAASAIGKQVNIHVGKTNAYNTETKDFTFTVVGVLTKTSSSAEVMISEADGIAMARYNTDVPTLYSEQQPGYVLQVRVQDKAQIDTVAQKIKDMGFSAITPAQILDQINKTFKVIQTVLAAFGIIALVVAAIGIVNTLIMAIYERTREIGVMKAVGATKGTIRALFTLEGAALGFLGGVVGVALAFIFGQALNFIAARTFLSSYPGFTISVFNIWLVLGVIALTTAIALVAGLAPANRAARLDPVESLRYE